MPNEYQEIKIFLNYFLNLAATEEEPSRDEYNGSGSRAQFFTTFLLACLSLTEVYKRIICS